MLLFGLTGGIASGKSTVAARFASRGVPVLDADAFAREVVLPGSEGLTEIRAAFGDGVIAPDGTLDRKGLARVVFADEASRKRLNAITHPRIGALTAARAGELAARGEPLACYEAALIVENGMADAFRPLVAVTAPEELRVARTVARDGSTEEAARARIAAQVSVADMTRAADFVIRNDADLAELHRTSDEVLARVCERAGAPRERYGLSDQVLSVSMMKHRTGTSSSYGTTDESSPSDYDPGGPEANTKSGLVLLYAPNFTQFQPAYLFDAPELIIGRDPQNAVCVPEQAVSRQHARISYSHSRWVVTDLGSRNGTMIDGGFIGEVELEHLHELRVGDAIFKFVQDGAERYVRYRIDGHVSGSRHAKTVKTLVGGCQMDHIAADIERIAPTELSCVILGETGTGKEVVANELHRASGRKGSFQAVNCAAIPQNLLESELFGYRRGAFSGADRDKPGLIKLADGGTLLLDEIGDMPLEAQAKLLRVLQAHEVFPLGATTPERVDIRVVCATHRDLHQFVSAGKFRGDLFARLNEHAVKLPPLRERKEDIYQLARAFAAKYAKPDLAFTFSFLVALMHYDWPFNVRELESCIKRGIALVDGGQPLDTRNLPDAIAEHMKSYGERPRVAGPSVLPPAPGGNPADRRAPDGSSRSPAIPASKRLPSEEELRALLVRHKGNVAAVGRELGKERMQVHRWLKRYQISLDDYRE